MCPITAPLTFFHVSTMSKRGGDSIRNGYPTVKKRKGVKIRTLAIPDSDEESAPSNVTSDYARLVKTRVKASGEAGSVTTSSILLTEVADITNDPPLEVDTGFTDTVLEDAVLTNRVTTRKRTKANDSVSPAKCPPLSSLTNGPPDQDDFMARRAVCCPRRDHQSRWAG